jgi:p-aminobenzoyl-glutamate transporter AbgT
VRLLDSLIAAGTGMRLRLVTALVTARSLATTAVLMLGVCRRGADDKQNARGKPILNPYAMTMLRFFLLPDGVYGATQVP